MRSNLIEAAFGNGDAVEEGESMLRLVEYGLLAVSLLTVIGLILMTPRGTAPKPAESAEAKEQQAGKG